MRFPRFSSLVLFAAAACTQTPTGTSAANTHLPRQRVLDGLGLGSGHITTIGSTTTTAATSGEATAAADSTANGRGGLGLGSGH